jgi:hypothetical protein
LARRPPSLVGAKVELNVGVNPSRCRGRSGASREASLSAPPSPDNASPAATPLVTGSYLSLVVGLSPHWILHHRRPSHHSWSAGPPRRPSLDP